MSRSIAAAATALDSLSQRWDDEKAHEDFADYAKLLRKLVPDGGKFVSASAEPFGFQWDTTDGQRHLLQVSGTKIVHRTIAKQYPAVKPVTRAAKAQPRALQEEAPNQEVPVAPKVPVAPIKATAKAPVKAAKPKKAIKAAATPKTPNACQCGCGGATFRNFVPGHDAKLVGMIRRGELKRLTPFQAEFARNHNIQVAPKAAKGKKVAA